jgi:hypothetical protein
LPPLPVFWHSTGNEFFTRILGENLMPSGGDQHFFLNATTLTPIRRLGVGLQSKDHPFLYRERTGYRLNPVNPRLLVDGKANTMSCGLPWLPVILRWAEQVSDRRLRSYGSEVHFLIDEVIEIIFDL